MMPRVFATHCCSPGAGRVVPQPRQAAVTTSAMAARMTRIYSTAPAVPLFATRHEARCQPSSPSDHGTAVARLKISSSASLPDQTPILSLSG